MPDVDSTLRQIACWRYIIVSDLSQSFYQIPLSNNSLKYCGVATPFKGVRVYTRCAMGMPGSETALEELMCRVLGDLLHNGCVAKIADDLYCGGNSPSELLANWRQVLVALDKCDLRPSAKKTIIAPVSTTILGWIWSAGSIHASPHRIAALASCPPPKTVRGLRAFIGSYKMLSRVIEGFAALLDPLERITAGNQSNSLVVWSETLLTSLKTAKKALSSNKTSWVSQPSLRLCQSQCSSLWWFPLSDLLVRLASWRFSSPSNFSSGCALRFRRPPIHHAVCLVTHSTRMSRPTPCPLTPQAGYTPFQEVNQRQRHQALSQRCLNLQWRFSSRKERRAILPFTWMHRHTSVHNWRPTHRTTFQAKLPLPTPVKTSSPLLFLCSRSWPGSRPMFSDMPHVRLFEEDPQLSHPTVHLRPTCCCWDIICCRCPKKEQTAHLGLSRNGVFLYYIVHHRRRTPWYPSCRPYSLVSRASSNLWPMCSSQGRSRPWFCSLSQRRGAATSQNHHRGRPGKKREQEPCCWEVYSWARWWASPYFARGWIHLGCQSSHRHCWP